MEAADYYLKSLEAFYELIKDKLTTKQRLPYQEKIAYLQEQMAKSERRRETSYFQESLEELDDIG